MLRPLLMNKQHEVCAFIICILKKINNDIEIMKYTFLALRILFPVSVFADKIIKKNSSKI